MTTLMVMIILNEWMSIQSMIHAVTGAQQSEQLIHNQWWNIPDWRTHMSSQNNLIYSILIWDLFD